MPKGLDIAVGIVDGLNNAMSNIATITMAQQKIRETKRINDLEMKQKKLEIEKLKNELSPEMYKAQLDKIKGANQYKEAQIKSLEVKAEQDKQELKTSAFMQSRFLELLDKYNSGQQDEGIRFNFSSTGRGSATIGSTKSDNDKKVSTITQQAREEIAANIDDGTIKSKEQLYDFIEKNRASWGQAGVDIPFLQNNAAESSLPDKYEESTAIEQGISNLTGGRLGRPDKRVVNGVIQEKRGDKWIPLKR